jgi:hypothetical protein
MVESGLDGPLGDHLGPDETGELAGDGGHDHSTVAFAFVETTEPATETNLRLPRPGRDLTGKTLLAPGEVDADAGTGLIRPGGLDQLGAQMRVPGMGDAASAGLLPRGVLRGGKPRERHERRRRGETPPVADLGGQTQRALLGDPPIRPQPVDRLFEGGPLVPGDQVRFDRYDGDLPGRQGRPVMGESSLEGQVIEALRPYPGLMLERPVVAAAPDPPVS